jgi:demethylmenaquinone methyltransferase/2-methoxy-6-polyprenyl-1,4-benzoquinol methylase
VAHRRVLYKEADLFTWDPEREYDLLLTAFWLSHVPPDRVSGFLEKIRRAVRSGGPSSSWINARTSRTIRRGSAKGFSRHAGLGDGRRFRIVNGYYHPALLAHALSTHGFTASAARIGRSFSPIRGQKTAPA